MILLALDTATIATVAGVLRADGSVVEVRDDPAPGARPAHASRLLAAAEEALATAGVGWEEIERLAVGVGPGSFTGLRIGIATARALAQGRGLPVVGVSTLEALAHGADAPLVLAVLDARRGEAFAAAWLNQGSDPFRRVEGWKPLLAPAALAPEALAERVRALPVPPLAVGDGAIRFRDSLEAAGAVVPPDEDGVHRLRAEHVCRLGAGASPTDRDALLPDYLREPDAVPRR
ncbi:MAG TPA: tRNA (adenosine(37)-N6)-threonylcarbamoyltransferase complex dimerization subunit type 1 TsaB [Solirubrobacteraceae bacterium]|nr:tRNA (adenosine(37)-N6)-threonylcarbamoyltransferase complex dimerization subunit type 1 TsaB [Solirubrobacteraceae bacterium]